MMRAAVYATPAPESALNRLAAAWLGRDAFSGAATRPAEPARDPPSRVSYVDIRNTAQSYEEAKQDRVGEPTRSCFVAEPARYGFHATLRAPFRPKPEVDLGALTDRLGAFCAGRDAPVIGRLVLARLGDFFALVPETPEPAIMALEAAVLDAFEPFRAPLTPEEVARRRPDRLTGRQRRSLDLWGYPFVLQDFRFHMTLTGPVPGPAEALRADLETHFAAVLGRPLPLDGLGLFVEPAPGAPFRVHSFHPFRAAVPAEPTGTP